ncbi:MAG: metal-dependent hydrolase [Reichenbachiella sp.]
MTGANHIVGGLVYTGIFCSFWDVNIFQRPWFIVATLAFSILPDIDHTKSPMGKAFSFTQLPQYLDRNFGHRTITHSLLVYFSLGLLIYFIEGIFSTSHTFTLIYFFAYSSHLIFDMMTVSGVPLFFPFKKNPCVIPGNPEYRMKVKDLKSEAIAFTVFMMMLVFCYPLMKDGFWFTFNKSFGTLEHLNREYMKEANLLNVEYDFIEKGRHQKGTGLLIHSEDGKVFLFDDESIFVVNKNMKVNKVTPAKTLTRRIENELYLYNVSMDSLNLVIRDKILIGLDFQSTSNIRYQKNGEYKKSKILKLEYVYNPTFDIDEDPTNRESIKQLDIKRIELNEEVKHIQKERTEYGTIVAQLHNLNTTFESMSLVQQEKAVRQIKDLESKRDNFTFSNKSTEKLEKQIEQLEEELNEKKSTYFTGKLTYLSNPKKLLTNAN